MPLDPNLGLQDLDSANIDSASVTIQGFVNGDSDVLGFTNQNGISGSYNSATGVLSLTGTTTVANYQTALRSVTRKEISSPASPIPSAWPGSPGAQASALSP